MVEWLKARWRELKNCWHVSQTSCRRGQWGHGDTGTQGCGILGNGNRGGQGHRENEDMGLFVAQGC